jgi:hypothetical protein
MSIARQVEVTIGLMASLRAAARELGAAAVERVAADVVATERAREEVMSTAQRLADADAKALLARREKMDRLGEDGVKRLLAALGFGDQS